MTEFDLKLIQSYASKRGGRLLTNVRAQPMPGELPKGLDYGKRTVDAVLLLDRFGSKLDGDDASAVPLAGERVAVIHAMTGKLAAPLLGQALFSPLLLEQRGAVIADTVALCGEDAPTLRRHAEETYKIVVVVAPNSKQTATTGRKPGVSAVREYWETSWKPKGASLLESSQLPEGCGPESIDGVIVADGRRQHGWSEVLTDERIGGKEIYVVHADARPKTRYGVWLLGASLFAADLVREQFNAASVKPLVLSGRRDDVLGPFAERFGVEVVIV